MSYIDQMVAEARIAERHREAALRRKAAAARRSGTARRTPPAVGQMTPTRPPGAVPQLGRQLTGLPRQLARQLAQQVTQGLAAARSRTARSLAGGGADPDCCPA